MVALRKESVDRNSWAARARVAQYCVALRKESVDRNRRHEDGSLRLDVALRKESVDRNQRIAKPFREQFKSLSARRAWIEMHCADTLWFRRHEDVALRKESVDRNSGTRGRVLGAAGSLSARRAWIEIVNYEDGHKLQWVALRKESVDRNIFHD